MGNAKSKNPENRVHLFRLQTLIIDGGLLVLRQVLDCKLQVQNTTLVGCLGQEKGVLTRLKAQNTITKVQYDLLYPPSVGQAPSTSDLDITLVICLLRNLKTCGLNRKFNWNVKPQAGDTSMEADMYRLKGFRNEIAHISSTTGIDLKEFGVKWTEIEQILIRLNSAVQNPIANLHQTFNEIKNGPVDPEAEKRIAEAIEEWREMEKGLEVAMELMKTELKEIKKHTSENTERITDTQKRVTDLETQRSKAQEDETRRKHRDLKEDLIRYYTSEHGTILLDPLFEEKDTPVINFYVMPDMNIIETQNGKENKTKVKSLSGVFKKDGEFSREVYLTADAGYGKTAFSKHLALIWCQAHSPDSRYTVYFDKDHLNAMRQFELLFLVLLRDSSDDCSIDEMIFNQIIKETSNSDIMNMSSLQAVLHRERYLVILDGLDEWTHPEGKCKRSPKSIPHRNAREKCVILTTTRPWKLGVINLKTSQISKKIELAKLSSMSAELLKERAISKIKGLDIRQATTLVKEFNAEVAKCSLGDLESVPLLLIYLIYLWCHNIPLGQSRCELYTSISELLLSRTVKKYPDLEPMYEHSQIDFPQWLNSDHEHCEKYFPLLTALGRLAFHTLFSKTRENTLVFDSSIAEKFLSKSELKFSLQSGIITESKVQVSALKQSSKISFAHKSVQEYFSALYMSCQSESDVQKIVQENCKSLQDILDMSAVFVFISGMNGEMMSAISRELMSVISEDEETIAYRSTTESYHSDPLRDIQNMYISCIKENPDNNDLKLCLQDFFIDDDCEQENYKTTLQRLAKQNKNNIKSVCIYNNGWCSLHEIIDSFELADLNHLQKLYCWSECKEADIIRLLSGTVKYASVGSPPLPGCSLCSMTSELCRRFQSLHQLEGIYISRFEMSHAVLEEFLNYLTNMKSMKEIRLKWLSDFPKESQPLPDRKNIFFYVYSKISIFFTRPNEISPDMSGGQTAFGTSGLSCTDHDTSCDDDDSCTDHDTSCDDDDSCTDHRTSCDDVKLDLSQHTDLRALELYHVPLSQLSINVASLEECVVGDLYKPGLTSSWLSQLPAASKLNRLWCYRLQSAADIETLVQTLPLLVHVKKVELWSINLGERSLRFSPDMVNIEYVRLYEMRLQSSSFHDLVKHVEQLPHSVTVKIYYCTITPETECEAVKQYVRQSENFVVTRDDWGEFEFVKSAMTTTTSH